MSGEISEALATAGEISKANGRRLERLEEDLYGPDGLRVQLTRLTTLLEPLPGQIQSLHASVAGLKAEALITKERRGIVSWFLRIFGGAAAAGGGAWIDHKLKGG